MTTIADANAIIGQLYTTLGRRIATARRARGHTQTDLAKAVGLSRASIANVEAGAQRTPVHVLIAIAQALGLDPADLITTGTETPELAPPMPPGSQRLRRRLKSAREAIDAALDAFDD